MNFVIDDQALANFRAKYSHVHPLVFQRSLDRATSAIHLFEILEGIPSEPPFSWDDSKRAWVPDKDVMGAESLNEMKRKKS